MKTLDVLRRIQQARQRGFDFYSLESDELTVIDRAIAIIEAAQDWVCNNGTVGNYTTCGVTDAALRAAVAALDGEEGTNADA